MLKLGVVIDAACELDQITLEHPALEVVPVKIEVDDQTYLDEKRPEFSSAFNRKYLNIRAAEVSKSVSMTQEEICQFFLNNMAARFDHVFGLFVTSTRSPLFKNAFNAASATINQSVPVRQAAGLKGAMFVEAHDSLNITDGYGVQVLELLRMIDHGATPGMVRQRIPQLADTAYTYLAPSQLDFVATRAKARGDESAGAFAVAAAKLIGLIPIVCAHRGQTTPIARERGVGKAREHIIAVARRELINGLGAPFINASFSGDVSVIEALASWQALKRDANSLGVQVRLKEMSPASSINLGPETLSIGMLGKMP
jgi:fatty acid-binding protein DegV